MEGGIFQRQKTEEKADEANGERLPSESTVFQRQATTSSGEAAGSTQAASGAEGGVFQRQKTDDSATSDLDNSLRRVSSGEYVKTSSFELDLSGSARLDFSSNSN